MSVFYFSLIADAYVALVALPLLLISWRFSTFVGINVGYRECYFLVSLTVAAISIVGLRQLKHLSLESALKSAFDSD